MDVQTKQRARYNGVWVGSVPSSLCRAQGWAIVEVRWKAALPCLDFYKRGREPKKQAQAPVPNLIITPAESTRTLGRPIWAGGRQAQEALFFPPSLFIDEKTEY